MKVIQWSKSLQLVMILIILLGSTGCEIGTNVDVGVDAQTRQVLEDAIDELGNWPGQWETTLNSVVDQLGKIGSELAKDIRGEVQTLISASTQILQEAVFCQIDFIGIRAKQHMQYILHKFFPDSDPAVFTPVICTANPTVVQSNSTSQVEYSGFDFSYFRDHGTFNADLVYGDNGELIRANFGTVNVVSNYHIVVDIQGFDYTTIISSRHPSLVVQWNSDAIGGQSEVPINIVFTPTSPPPTVYVYELNYASGYEILAGGPNRGGGFASMACPSGYIITGLLGKKGDYITGIGLYCSLLRNDGMTGERISTKVYGNNGGVTWDGLMCPPNKALTGINGVYGGYVDKIQGICSYVANIENPGPSETGWAGETGADVNINTSSCDPGYFVTGIKIKWGDYIDGLTMICTQVVRR